MNFRVTPSAVAKFMEGKICNKVREGYAQQIYMLTRSTRSQAFNFTKKSAPYLQLPQCKKKKKKEKEEKKV